MCDIYIFLFSIGIVIDFVYIFYVVESTTISREEKSRTGYRNEDEKACGKE